MPPPAPPPMNVTVSAAAPAPRQWKLEWPDDASPEGILDWGMTIRANLVEKDETFAELVWGRPVHKIVDRIDIDPAHHTDGNDLDLSLSSSAGKFYCGQPPAAVQKSAAVLACCEGITCIYN